MELLADTILLVHFGFVAFVVGGLGLIWIGAALQWRWVRNFWFRIVHLAAIVFVAGQALLGRMCPLTLWEDALREGQAPGKGFIARWVYDLLYWDLPGWVFTVVYVLFALVVIASFWWVKPRSPRR